MTREDELRKKIAEMQSELERIECQSQGKYESRLRNALFSRNDIPLKDHGELISRIRKDLSRGKERTIYARYTDGGEDREIELSEYEFSLKENADRFVKFILDADDVWKMISLVIYVCKGDRVIESYEYNTKDYLRIINIFNRYHYTKDESMIEEVRKWNVDMEVESNGDQQSVGNE